MLNSYSDIKRYNLNPEFLFQTTRKVIHHLGWNIHNEIEPKIVAIISNGLYSPLSRIKVKVHKGYIALCCETDSDLVLHYHFDNHKRVCQLLNTFDNHINAFPADELMKHAETFGHSFKGNFTIRKVFNN